MWRATGVAEQDFGKPIIAIANSFTQFVPGHVHLKDMGQLVARGHELTAHPADADVLVVNTCSFIDPAKQESVDTILEMAEYKKTGRAVIW